MAQFHHRQVGSFAWGVITAALALAVALLWRRDVDYSDRGRRLRARAQEERLAASRMRDLLMAGTSHDLKTPLASIRLLTHLIHRDAANGSITPEKLRERAALIELNVTTMSSLIGELLDVARLQGGGAIDLQLTETDLVALAHKVADSFELTAGKHRLLVDAAQPVLTGRWDASRIERVLTNLVSNSLKYSPDGGDVTIRVACEQRRGHDLAVLSVTDEGIGIPARDLPRLFEWFHRGSNVGDSAGSGIGLASARLIVEKHGGDMSAFSREGKGATVTLRLPVEAEAHDEAPRWEAVMPPAREQLAASLE